MARFSPEPSTFTVTARLRTPDQTMPSHSEKRTIAHDTLFTHAEQRATGGHSLARLENGISSSWRPLFPPARGFTDTNNAQETIVYT